MTSQLETTSIMLVLNTESEAPVQLPQLVDQLVGFILAGKNQLLLNCTTLPAHPYLSEITMNRHLTDMIIKYENGELNTEEDIISLFQELIDTGHAWTLQGHYGRTAKALIEAGYCKPKEVFFT